MSIKVSESTRRQGGWTVLAAAIIASGVKENDKAFLEGAWCAQLREFVKMGIEERDKPYKTRPMQTMSRGAGDEAN